MLKIPLVATLSLLPLVLAGCTPQSDSGASGNGDRVSSTDESLKGCHHQASRIIPDDGIFVVTTFGGPDEPSSGLMSCGENTRNGSWYYSASRQRFGCGAHVRMTSATSCVVVETDDYGPDVCVENAAGLPIMDVSPLAASALFGVSHAGWSDHRTALVEVVDDSTPLGPCDGTGTPPMTPAPTPPDPSMQCNSATLGCNIPLAACVQSGSDQHYYQCTSLGWVKTYNDGTGPLGQCTENFPLGSSCPTP
jgi:hypothetical protein